jgi:anaerobic glycerol-3-phosphate dehydrogenase
MTAVRSEGGWSRAHVAVIGAGVAGTSAALAAANAGVAVTIVDGGTGASTLATGAIDLVPWQSDVGPLGPLPSGVQAALDALGGYRWSDAGALVLTTAGLVRRAGGHDASVLDVASIPEGRVGVVRCDRPGWDAPLLARAWGDRYAPCDVTVLRRTDEHVLVDADFAARHDDAERLGWLSERLREALARAGGSFAAIVLPPALGVECSRAEALSALTGVRCGEAIGLPGGPAGLRFERARDRALAAATVRRLFARATAIAQGDRPRGEPKVWRVRTDRAGDFEADAIVVAMGGLLGGGVEYSPSEAVLASVLPPRAWPPFRLVVDAPLTLGAHGRPLETPGSLFGVAPEALAWPYADDPLFERVGVLVDDAGAAAGADGAEGATRGVFAAGEIVADAARTWLGALASGVLAGQSAARQVLASTYGETPRRSIA